jgi:enamine deaminase RidA (YjgF/YER057c/UK114 family)
VSTLYRKNLMPDTLSKRVVNGKTLYTQVVVVEAKRVAFISGQVPRDRNGNTVGKGDMAAQIRQCCENVKAGVEAAGGTLADLVKTSTFVTDLDEYFKHTDVRMEYMSQGMPTSTTIQISRLSHPDYMVEIEAIAVIA